MMKLRKGMIVNYHPTPTECGKMREHRSTCNISEELPAVVVAVWGEDMVNLKVLLDGVGDQWATSVHRGDEVGQWNFYPEETTVEAETAAKEEVQELDSLELLDVSGAEVIAEEQPKEEPAAKPQKGGKKV